MTRTQMANMSQAKDASTMLVRRQCACGAKTPGGDTCSKCQTEGKSGLLQRAASAHQNLDGASPIVHDTLRELGQPLDQATRDYFEPRFGAGLGNLRLPGSNLLQRKLTINEPGDVYEREADNIASMVMNMAVPMTRSETSYSPPRIQRLSSAVGANDAVPQSVYDVTNSSGQPLEGETRALFESRFGGDFSTVRIHTDSAAADSAAAVNARAYTVGAHIAFGHGQYQPATFVGQHLLAHELTHVMQQTESGAVALQRSIEGCRNLLQQPGTASLLSGNAVHKLVQVHFNSTVVGARSVGIPGASSGPARSQGICGGDTTIINPQIVGGMSGMGFPDMARLTPGRVLQVAELKPAALVCLIDGEQQLLRYVDQGNATDSQQRTWRSNLGVSVVTPMPESAYVPPVIWAPTFRVEFSWCAPGLLAYAVIPTGAPITVPVPRDVRENERENARRVTARRVGTTIAVGAGVAIAGVAGRALWRHFWKVVIRRFALRGALMLALAALDGPLPFGELLDLGIAAVTAVQIIADWNEIWAEADIEASRSA